MSYVQLNNFADYEILNEFPFTIRRIEDHRVVAEDNYRNNGYPCIYLNGRLYYKHRIIAEQFIENDDPEHKTQIDHINHDRTDYHLENIRWTTNRENARNKSFYKGVTYNFIDELPDDYIDVTSYETKKGLREFNDKEYYYSPSTDLFYYYNGKQYRELNINNARGSLFVMMNDKNNRLVSVTYTKFKVQYDLVF